jgi:hypothetical protein
MIKVTLQKYSLFRIKESIETAKLVYGSERGKDTANSPVTSTAYLENKHLHNPTNESLIIQFLQDEDIRGHIFLIERGFILDGELNPVLVASDLVSKADIPGASIIIYRKALQYCKENDVPFLNFSNKKSDQIYSQIMKMIPVVELDFQLGNFNYKALLLNLIRHKRIEKNEKSYFHKSDGSLDNENLTYRIIPKFTDSIDTFLESLEKKNISFGKRDSKILNWRFNSANQLHYARILIIRDGKICGYLVVCERLIKEKRLLVIVDFVIWMLNSREIRKLRKTLNKLFPNSIACLWVSNSQHTQKNLGNFKGFTVPKRLSPERLKFYLSSNDERFKLGLREAHLTLFDTDIH